MALEKYEIKQYQTVYKCDKCGHIMHYDKDVFGQAMLTYIKSNGERKAFKHICPECGYEIFLDDLYPTMTTEVCI